MQSKKCSCSWANNDGGVWCPEHRLEVPDGACESCPRMETIRHVMPMCETPITNRRAMSWACVLR